MNVKHPPDNSPPADASEVAAIEPGMPVATTEGDLGAQDLTKPHVAEVVRDASGEVEAVVIEKGVIFKKQIEVPAERVVAVETAAANDGASPAAQSAPDTDADAHETPHLLIDVSESETEALSTTRPESIEALPAATLNDAQPIDGLLAKVEEEVPTIEGMGRLEERNARASTASEQPQPTTSSRFSLRSLGPGFLAGMAGNDSSAVTSYSVNGATNGYGQLWLILLATPLLQAVQFACAKMGRVSQHGFAEVLRERYGRRVAGPAALLLFIANLGLISADLVAVGTGFQLLTGIAWEWFVLPVAVALWYLTIYKDFGVIKRIFMVLSLAFIAYIITGIFSGANWGLVLHDTFTPHIGLDFASISSAVALLGATVSPYTMFWQVQGEKEERRTGTMRQQVRTAGIDIGVGVVSGNLIAYFIIVCTSATLFAHHKSITTAADAARALEPLLGPYARYFFALGLIGAGLVAIPVLLASTSYAAAGTFGWAASLWKKPWQTEGFYLILTAALVVSVVVAFLGFDPVQLIFWANVLQGILSPALVILLIIVANDRRVMGKHRLGRITNICLVVTAVVMTAATILLFYGILTGRGG